MPSPLPNSENFAPRARLDALERRHTGPPPREDWLEARFGGPAALAAIRASVRRADAGRAAAHYRLAIARLRANPGHGADPGGSASSRLARLCEALGTARTQAVAHTCAHPCN